MSEPYYSDDLVTLYHGDCREVTAWLEADVLVTDPPYGVDWSANAITWYGMKGERPPVVRVAGDKDARARDDALSAWGTRPAVVFGSWRVARPAGVRHLLIWHKVGRNPGPNPAPWFSAHEEIYVLGDGFTGKPEQTVYATTENRAQAPAADGHPTPKPVGLMERLVAKCPPGVVADPFAGSGATLSAARNLGRRAIGVELEEKYCDVIAKRLSQDTLFGGVA
jgi:hypothetical protein